jgi:hypothetical protein
MTDWFLAMDGYVTMGHCGTVERPRGFADATLTIGSLEPIDSDSYCDCPGCGMDQYSHEVAMQLQLHIDAIYYLKMHLSQLQARFLGFPIW